MNRDNLPDTPHPAGMTCTPKDTTANPEPNVDTKDYFMRFAFIGSVILVGVLALAVRLYS